MDNRGGPILAGSVSSNIVTLNFNIPPDVIFFTYYDAILCIKQ